MKKNELDEESKDFLASATNYLEALEQEKQEINDTLVRWKQVKAAVASVVELDSEADDIEEILDDRIATHKRASMLLDAQVSRVEEAARTAGHVLYNWWTDPEDEVKAPAKTKQPVAIKVKGQPAAQPEVQPGSNNPKRHKSVAGLARCERLILMAIQNANKAKPHTQLTYKEIVARINRHGDEVAYSSLSRYLQDLRDHKLVGKSGTRPTFRYYPTGKGRKAFQKAQKIQPVENTMTTPWADQ